MLTDVLGLLIRGRRSTAVPALPGANAPSVAPEIPSSERLPSERVGAVRETIDLLEADLAKMIGDVQQAAQVVRHGIRDSGTALAAIRGRSNSLATPAGNAKGDANQLAVATEEFSQSSNEIGRQV